MGLLDRTNPKATRRTATRWAGVGGLVGFAVCLSALAWYVPPAVVWFFALPLVTAASAAVMGLIEWQVPDDG